MRKLKRIVVGASVLVWVGVAVSTVPVAGAELTMADEIVQSKVVLQLEEDGRINWEELRVMVDQGHVTLFGEVASPEEKGWAETIASTVPGVHSIRNDVIVDVAHSPDYKIRLAVWDALKQTPALERNPTIKVSVRQAAVTLKGDVLDDLSKKAAEKATEGVSGVKNVINRLQVVDRLPPQKLNNIEVVR